MQDTDKIHASSRRPASRHSRVGGGLKHVPYCDAFFTDRFMADLLNDKNVDAEQTFGCKVFSVSKTAEFFGWLEDVKSRMTADHADGLTWAYLKYRSKATES
jgi:hypothetical protein